MCIVHPHSNSIGVILASMMVQLTFLLNSRTDHWVDETIISVI